MRINSIKTNYKPVNFGDALSTKQEKDYQKLIAQINKVQGKEDGTRIVKLYPYALPSSEQTDCGIGKINSPEAKRFYEIAKNYGGATAIKFMPLGQLTDKPVYSDNKYPGAYNRASFALGEDIIDITQLATKRFGNILPEREVRNFVNRHKDTHTRENLIDFGTTLGWQNQENYPVNDLLRSAFYNFKDESHNNKELNQLRKEFEAFKNKKEPIDYDDIYTRLALFPYLKDWTTAKTDFFVGFDSNPEIRAQRMPEYNRLKDKYKNEIEFYKFKQFLAYKTLEQGKKEVNDLGMDLVGDCILGYSWTEVQAFPDAFLKDGYGRMAEFGTWGIPAINYYDLMNDKNSTAYKFFKAKVTNYLHLYDSVRFDVGWGYMNTKFHFGDKNFIQLDTGNRITDIIEEIAREVKGENFDQRKLMYECDANGSDFNLWTNADKIRHLKGRAILSTEEEKNDSANIGWGNLSFLRENIGLSDDNMIVGTNTHDGRGLLSCAHDMEKSTEQVGAMMRVLKLRPQDGCPDGWRLLKDDNSDKEHIRKYTRGRFAEIDLAKNSFIQYTDLLGRAERVDYHTNGTRYSHPELYEKVKKYAAYLKHKGGIFTKAQADNTARANLDIGNMSIQDIQKLNRIV